MDRLEAAILDAIESHVLTEDVLAAMVKRTIARHAVLAAQGAGRRGVLEAELADVRVRIERYVRALGEGVAIEEIRAQLSACKLREQALVDELALLSPLPAGPSLDRAALRRRLGEWHGLLRQTPQVARQLLRKLLPEPIVLESTSEGVRFRGRAAWGAVLAGAVQGVGLVVPPG